MKVIRLILTLLHLVLFFALAAMLLNSFIPPGFKWFNFVPLVFPPLIIAYIVLTIVWIATWKKRLYFFIGLLSFSILSEDG
jgi:hypothetical protein